MLYIPKKILVVSQLLYFGQFTCNAFYLSTTIYETSTTPMRIIKANISFCRFTCDDLDYVNNHIPLLNENDEFDFPLMMNSSAFQKKTKIMQKSSSI